MDKHNRVLERVALVERENKAQWREIEDLKQRPTKAG